MFSKITKIFQTVSKLNDKVGESIHEFIDTVEAINKQGEAFVNTNKDIPPELAKHWGGDESGKLQKKNYKESPKRTTFNDPSINKIKIKSCSN